MERSVINLLTKLYHFNITTIDELDSVKRAYMQSERERGGRERERVAGGDYNSKHYLWGSRLNNPKGRNLHSCRTSQGYFLFLLQVTPNDPRQLLSRLINSFVTYNLNLFSTRNIFRRTFIRSLKHSSKTGPLHSPTLFHDL